MKQLCKRSLAAILLLVILVGYFSGVSIRVNAASYVYNWGTREDVADQADFAHSTAEEWYAKYNTSLEELMALSGSSSTSAVPSSSLYTKLKSLMTSAHSHQNGYDANNTLLAYTDCQNGGGAISSFYSGKSIGPGWDKGKTWNKEHTWPNSKGLEGKDEDDVMMIRPTSVSENSGRSNTAYGESAGYYHPNTESNKSGGKYDLRGDCARICLYVYVRWGNTEKMWGPNTNNSGVIESKEVLLKWMEEDPVDTWELGRNDSVQSITGTRNVFVDYPELAFELFDADIPAGYQSPSGSASSAYTITATSSNTSYGTVSVSGKTITASPKTGYYASGYTVTSGTATVTQDGNKFTVNASSNCTIQINFAAKTSVTVSFSGANVPAQTGYGGDSMKLPTVQDPEGFKFLGWMTAPLQEDTTEKPTYYTGSFIPNKTVTLYALYSYVDETTSGGTGDYVKVTAAPADWSGEYLIVYETDRLVLNGNSVGDSNYITITINNQTISADVGDLYKFTIAAYSSGYSIQGLDGKYISGTSNDNKLNSGSSPSANTLSVDGSGNVNVVSNGSYLRYNATAKLFRYYKSSSYSSQKPIALYVKDGSVGTTYYTTNITECEHSNVVVDEAVAATCQDTGLTEGSHCGDCGQVLVEQTVINTVACEYSAIDVIPPTCTEMGYSTYSCIWCGEVDEETDYVDALGHSYGDNGVCGVCGANKELLAGWNLILTDRIGMSFHLNLTAEEAAKTQVRFTVNGATSTADAQIKNGKYVFTLALAAAQMTEKVTVEILSGGEVVQTGEYSVRQYAETVLKDEDGKFTDATKALVKAMLNYGAEAQRYFRCNTGNLADTGYVQESFTAVPAIAAKYPVSGSVSGISYYGASLLFHSNVAARFYFTGDVSKLTFTAGGKTLTPVKKGDMYYVQVSDILPQDMDKAVVLTVSDSTSTMTVSYSPLDYIANQSANGDAGLKALMLKMYNYHLAAKAYAN